MSPNRQNVDLVYRTQAEIGYTKSTFCRFGDLIKALKTAKSGRFSEYMNDLVVLGFLEQNFVWSLTEGGELKRSQFRICDNYSRFYLKYIYPNRNRIQNGSFEDMFLASLDNWYTMLGLQFETLVLNNRQKIINLLRLKKEDIIYDGPYFQTKTLRQEACQIDYLIQTRTNNIYVVEIKFYKGKVRQQVIKDVSSKIAKLNLPHNISVRPVLVHVNGVEKSVGESDFFVEIIDFGKMIKKIN